MPASVLFTEWHGPWKLESRLAMQKLALRKAALRNPQSTVHRSRCLRRDVAVAAHCRAAIFSNGFKFAQVAAEVPAVLLPATPLPATSLPITQPVVDQQHVPGATKSAQGAKSTASAKGTKKQPKKKKKKGGPRLSARFERMIDVSMECWKKKPRTPGEEPWDDESAAHKRWKADSAAYDAWKEELQVVKNRWNACSWQTIKQKKVPVAESLRIFNRCKVGGYVNHMLLLFLVDGIMNDPKALEKFDAVRVSMAVNSLGMMARDSRDVNDPAKDESWGKYVLKKHADRDSNENYRTERFFTDTCLDFVASLLAHARKENILPDKLDLRGCGSITHGLGLLFPVEDASFHFPPPHVKQAVTLMVKKFGREVSKTTCEPINMSCLLHGCANVQHQEDLGPVCDAVQKALQRGDDFSEQHVSNITWALGRLGTGGQPLFDLLETQIVRKVDQFIPQGLANTVYGLGLRAEKGGIRVSKKVVKALENEADRPARRRRFSEQDLNSLEYGFRQLGVYF
ncbi:hypothetical protein BSKO_13042 [Bryopsis sp. KO-2023]|nr:hypothetical protein BSKO_13042 [Bryopsis sp. KO-2023]